MNLFILALFCLSFAPIDDKVTDDEKKAFFELLSKLPTRGEFFTEESEEKAAPYTRVLLALTDKDLEKRDMYLFASISAGLIGRKEPQKYGVKHFDSIASNMLKLFWGTGLFNAGVATPQIVKYLRSSLESKEQAAILSSMLGPEFEDFKKRLKEYR